MGAHVFDKTKFPSRHVTQGAARAPHRAFCTIAVTDGIAMGQPGMRGHCAGAELTECGKRWKPRPTDYGSGAVWKYAQTGRSAKDGAVMRPGFAGETHVYADL